MKLLVTGGCGFLGARFALRARADAHEVVTLDLVEGADIRCDLGDELAVASVVLDVMPNAIAHLGARLTTASDSNPVSAVRVNALGTAALFAAAEQAHVERIVFASSVAAVGPGGQSGDAAPLFPATIYGATKAFDEHLARAMSERPGAPRYLALRFGWVYGPGRKRGWRTPQELIERIAEGERRVRYPDYAEPIDWTWVGDAVEMLARSLVRPLPRFAAVNALGDRRTMREAAAHLTKRFPDLVAEPEPAATPPSAWGLRNEGLAALIGAIPCMRLEDGLDRMIEEMTAARRAQPSAR